MTDEIQVAIITAAAGILIAAWKAFAAVADKVKEHTEKIKSHDEKFDKLDENYEKIDQKLDDLKEDNGQIKIQLAKLSLP